jgi:hypothetical protein
MVRTQHAGFTGSCTPVAATDSDEGIVESRLESDAATSQISILRDEEGMDNALLLPLLLLMLLLPFCRSCWISPNKLWRTEGRYNASPLET